MQTEDLHDILDTVEVMIRSLVTTLSNSTILDQILFLESQGEVEEDEKPAPNLSLIHRRWDGLIKNPWPRITYKEVMYRLQEAASSHQMKFQHKPSWSTGLKLEHEKFIAAEIGHGSPVFVTHYPQRIKPFYMLSSKMRSNESSVIDMRDTAECFDLLFPEVGEIVGGSLREHRLHQLIQAMHEHGLVPPTRGQVVQENEKANNSPSASVGSLDWYAELRRFGSVPHGGFGLGFDRLLGYLVGISNIKDVVPWPRYYGRCDC